MATLDLDILQGSLEKLQGDVPELLGSAIVSPDGLILVSTFKDRDQNDKLAAMSSEMLTAANMTVDEMSFGDMFMSIVFGTEGGVIIRSIDEEMVLSALVARGSNVGKVIQSVNLTVNRIRSL